MLQNLQLKSPCDCLKLALTPPIALAKRDFSREPHNPHILTEGMWYFYTEVIKFSSNWKFLLGQLLKGLNSQIKEHFIRGCLM